jgi:hypothetical protein
MESLGAEWEVSAALIHSPGGLGVREPPFAGIEGADTNTNLEIAFILQSSWKFPLLARESALYKARSEGAKLE